MELAGHAIDPRRVARGTVSRLLPPIRRVPDRAQASGGARAAGASALVSAGAALVGAPQSTARRSAEPPPASAQGRIRALARVAASPQRHLNCDRQPTAVRSANAESFEEPSRFPEALDRLCRRAADRAAAHRHAPPHEKPRRGHRGSDSRPSGSITITSTDRCEAVTRGGGTLVSFLCEGARPRRRIQQAVSRCQTRGQRPGDLRGFVHPADRQRSDTGRARRRVRSRR